MIDINNLIKYPNPYIQFEKEMPSENATKEEDNQFKEKWMFGKQPNHENFAIAFIELIKDTNGSSYNELMKYRNVVPKLINYIDELRCNLAFFMHQAFLIHDESRNNKRWGKEEDETIIEEICKEDGLSIKELSSALQRSESAVRTRITYLVGVKRLSQKVVGKFIGTVDGEDSEVQLKGTLYKE